MKTNRVQWTLICPALLAGQCCLAREGDALEQAGIKTTSFESPGTPHEWLAWRRTQSRPSNSCPTPAAATRQLKLLWLSCGNKDGLIRISQGVHAYLKEKKVPHVWHVDGNGHDATHWRKNLWLFSQRIFR